MRCLLAVFVVCSCGNAPTRHITDAPGRDDAPVRTVDAPTCGTYIAATTTAPAVLSYTLSGGAFESYGCAPIDPTYWISGSGMSATVTFVQPQTHPSLRIWGMNTDDTAAVTVNGTVYSLEAASASLDAKVVCGLSPGTDGMVFVGGMLTGANTPSDGNYSYQNLTIEQSGVTSIEIAGLTGAGWGLAGVSIASCAPQ